MLPRGPLRSLSSLPSAPLPSLSLLPPRVRIFSHVWTRGRASAAYSGREQSNGGVGGGGVSDRSIVISYPIYKSKAALCLRPVKPVFKKLETGVLALHREGVVLLEFASSTGIRQYDWTQKLVFALSVAEIGEVLSFSSSDKINLLHDPNKGRDGEGTVIKTLQIVPMKDGYFFNLSMRKDGQERKVSLPISTSEFSVIRTALNYILPYLMGWHAFVDPSIIEPNMLDGSRVYGVPSTPFAVQDSYRS